MMFKYVLFDDFESMLLSSLIFSCSKSINYKNDHLKGYLKLGNQSNKITTN